MMKKAAACALAIVFLLSACGMAKSQNSASESAYSTNETGSSYNSYKEESYDYDVEAEESMDFAEDDAMPAAAAGGSDAGGDTKADEGGEQADLASENRKIVYSGNISLQTLEYDSSSQSIHDKINKYGDDYYCLDESFASEKYGICFRKDDTELCKQVEDAYMQLVEDGTYIALGEKYGLDTSYLVLAAE